MNLKLSDRELERYGRQLVVEEIGIEGQLKLKTASAMVIGAGALGTMVAGYLAAAGVGRLGIADHDKVELSNLQRQFLHFPPDIGANKAEALAEKLGVLNPEIIVEPYPARLDASNAQAMIAGTGVVIDCSDNYDTRYLLNETCVREEITLIETGVSGLKGLVTTVDPGNSACYLCMFPDRPDEEDATDCEEAGIVGPIAGVMGSVQALEAIKVITGVGETLAGRVLQIEGFDTTVSVVKVERRKGCAVCAS